MTRVDDDLLSIQQARVLLERAEESRVVLENLSSEVIDDFVACITEKMLPKCTEYAEAAFAESDYGNAEDEAALTEWVLTELFEDVCRQVPVQKMYERPESHSIEVCLSKGTVVSLLPDWLSVPTLFSQVVSAIKSKSPIIFSATRAHATCAQVMEDLQELAEACSYPVEALGYLEIAAPEGECWLVDQEAVRVIIDSRETARCASINVRGKDVYYASVGNNPAFIESTADLARCAKEIVLSKSFCYGLLPGAEQSLVVEKEVDQAFKAELCRQGCYFLTDAESERLINLLFAPDGHPYKELIGKSAQDLARRADISVPASCKVLVMEKPYVSELSNFVRAKFAPVLSYYVEESWRNACEKCIELILDNGNGNALAIFSQDPDVIEQFVLKKPVGRVLVNVSTGLGAIGCHSQLPKTLTIAGWELATTSRLGVTYRDFIRRRQVGIANVCQDLPLLNGIGPTKASSSRPSVAQVQASADKNHGAQAAPAAHAASDSSDDWFASLLRSVQAL